MAWSSFWVGALGASSSAAAMLPSMPASSHPNSTSSLPAIRCKISPNVSLWPADLDPDPLGSFLLSLERLRQVVPTTSFVLPSHNLPFYGLHTRLDQLAALHAA